MLVRLRIAQPWACAIFRLGNPLWISFLVRWSRIAACTICSLLWAIALAIVPLATRKKKKKFYYLKK
jgi:hypothetical protein